ncbi:MAG TPA: hypothetical protein VGB70_02180 [Allosphingosinicella sp.]|jgi:uncharacterized membrane protein
MGTKADSAGKAAVRRGFMADQDFFTRYTVALALFILFGFAQFSLRGFVDVRRAPLLTHVHGVLMVAWLALAVAQNLLVHRGELRLHRALGWAGVVLVAAIAVAGVSVGFSALIGHRGPPFFSEPYFLALTTIEPIVFAAMVAWGISLRRKTEYHRRAMLGSLVVLLEPALGRVLPMPLMNGWGEWTIVALQLLALLLLARHDRKLLGKVHPVTVSLLGIVLAAHLAVRLLSNFAPFGAFAERLAA